MLLAWPVLLYAGRSIPTALKGKAVYDKGGVLTYSKSRTLTSQR